MRTRILMLVGMSLLLSAGCNKKADKPSSPGGEVGGAMNTPAPTRPRGLAARRAAALASAAAACPKGAWPGHALGQEAYTITVVAPKEAKVGAPVRAQVTVVPKAGYHVNQKYPASLTIQSAGGLSFAKKSLDKGEAATLTKEKLTFGTSATVKSAGHHVVKAELSFSVCTPKLCLTEPDMCVAWELTAK